ncbi:MAG TPA: crotonyl-CoA carboxylase/reductase, partial [bacterium]|nr:crotonyl-CoA carboxylase/reductase [bacterium]
MLETKPEYAIGEIPPLGVVPERMHSWVIRRERHGEPRKSFQRELMPIP